MFSAIGLVAGVAATAATMSGGKDIIFGFDEDDMLQITGDWSASIFHVNDATYRISGNKLVKQ